MVATKVLKKEKSKEKWKKIKKSDLKQKNVSSKSSKLSNPVKDIEIKWDKVLEKVEKMVEKNWETTENDIRKRKSKRKPDDYKDVNLDVMLTRISEQSKAMKSASNFAGKFLYFLYFLIIIVILIFVAKWLMLSQNS